MINNSIKIKNLKLKIILLLVTCYLLLVTAPTAQASALSLGIDPPIIVINAIPPTAVTSSLNIQNKSDMQVTLQIQLKLFKTKGENGELEYSKETPEIFKNIQVVDANVPVENITLGPRQQKSLNLSINIPQYPARNASQGDTGGINISPADYYFSIIFVSQNTSIPTSTLSLNQAGIATNVLLSIGAKETPKATVEEFSSNIFFEKGPVPFTIRVKNTGLHFIRPMGEITIKNMFGQSIGKLDLYGVNILSDSIRAIPNDIYMQELRLKSNLDTKGKFPVDFRHPIVLWKESFLLGLYAANLNISMSNEGPTFARTIYFFAFPFQGLIIIVILVSIAIIVRNRLKLHLNRDLT